MDGQWSVDLNGHHTVTKGDVSARVQWWGCGSGWGNPVGYPNWFIKTHSILPLTDRKFYHLLTGKSSMLFLDKLTRCLWRNEWQGLTILPFTLVLSVLLPCLCSHCRPLCRHLNWGVCHVGICAGIHCATFCRSICCAGVHMGTHCVGICVGIHCATFYGGICHAGIQAGICHVGMCAGICCTTFFQGICCAGICAGIHGVGICISIHCATFFRGICCAGIQHGHPSCWDSCRCLLCWYLYRHPFGWHLHRRPFGWCLHRHPLCWHLWRRPLCWYLHRHLLCWYSCRCLLYCHLCCHPLHCCPLCWDLLCCHLHGCSCRHPVLVFMQASVVLPFALLFVVLLSVVLASVTLLWGLAFVMLLFVMPFVQVSDVCCSCCCSSCCHPSCWLAFVVACIIVGAHDTQVHLKNLLLINNLNSIILTYDVYASLLPQGINFQLVRTYHPSLIKPRKNRQKKTS